MAKKVVYQFTDDLDGTVLGDDGETVEFSLDGTSYEIDLSIENAAELRELLGKYISVARAVTKARRTGGRTATSVSQKRDLTAVREWARSSGHEVSARGRIAAPILEAYDAAHGG